MRANAWRIGGHLTQSERDELSCEHIRSELHDYYTTLSRTVADITNIPHFSLRTIGGAPGKVLRTKAAETKFLLGCVVKALQERGNGVAYRTALIQAGTCLQEFDKYVCALPRRVGSAEAQHMLQLLKRFAALGDYAGVEGIPKYHLAVHMVVLSPQQGSPMFAATWKDEALNRVLAAIAKGAGSAHFEARVLLRFRAEQCGALPASKKQRLHAS